MVTGRQSAKLDRAEGNIHDATELDIRVTTLVGVWKAPSGPVDVRVTSPAGTMQFLRALLCEH